jgi:hypothetical protein
MHGHSMETFCDGFVLPDSVKLTIPMIRVSVSQIYINILASPSSMDM